MVAPLGIEPNQVWLRAEGDQYPRTFLELEEQHATLDLGTATYQMLTGSGAGYSLRGAMSIGTQFGDLEIPYEKIGQTIFQR